MENFKRTKIELEQDLNDQMRLACSEYRDSMVQSIFKVITNDSMDLLGKPPLSFVKEKDSLLRLESLVVKHRFEGGHFPGRQGDKESSISITIDKSDTAQTEKSIIVWQSEHSEHLKFNYSTDTIIERLDSLQLRDRLHSSIDSIVTVLPNVYSRLDSIFSSRLQRQNILIPHRLTEDSIDLSHSGNTIIIAFDYQSFGFNSTPVVLFENYQPYLWKKLSFSITMSLLLFGVVSVSFFALLNTWLKQQRLASIKNEFISNMTHELKTPISTIAVALEALENYGGLDDPIKRTEYLNISKHEVNRLGILVDKVLKMSTTDHSESILQLDTVDIKAMTENMLNSMHLHFEKHKVNLDYQCTAEAYTTKGDKVHLTNVLYNLIDNAIKYSGEKPEISVRLTSSPIHVIIEVSDEGPGISKAFQSKVFDRFFRIPTQDIHNVKGYGLGLHYVATVIRKHGGSLELKSEEGQGCLFTIKLPIA